MGRSNSPKNLSALRNKLQMPVQTGGILGHEGKTATPLGSIFIHFAIRGCRFAQPPANGFNPLGV